MLNGIINIYKEPGFTSHDVVAKLRGIVGQKKIGHTGTLDPDAEGVLCVCLGAATRVCDMLTDATKEYVAVMKLGVSTDTQDTSGRIISEREVTCTEDEVRDCIAGFIGDIEQIPPMYSAIKQNGKKLYELARAGIEVERKPRHITIYDIAIESIDLPEVTMRVVCSKGTYIRTLCNDIGEKLGCGASMKHLTRTRVGAFGIDGARKLSEVEDLMHSGKIADAIIPPTKVFEGLKHLTVNDQGARRAANGNMLGKDDFSLHNTTISDSEELIVKGNDGFFYGIYRFNASEGQFKPVKMFLC